MTTTSTDMVKLRPRCAFCLYCEFPKGTRLIAHPKRLHICSDCLTDIREMMKQDPNYKPETA